MNPTMPEIDFLPADFKARHTRRHGRSWQAIVIAAAIGLLVVVAVGQSRTLHQIEAKVAQVEPERQMLLARQLELEQLRAEVAQREARAQLLAYMRHPWPRTQLLSAILASLPETIACEKIHISREAPGGQALPQAVGDAGQEDLAKLQPAERDLRLLQGECDPAVVAIVLEGTTGDGIELHRYLNRLNRVPLLDKVELHSLEATTGDTQAKFRFEARITVRPGFGQPRGPDGNTKQIAQAPSPSSSKANRP
ncbi:MAG: hypothetical protein ACYC6Y_13090 [Thermoguttaceae bacterium]